MTEYEMTDVIMSRFSQMIDTASLYFALVSGYLVLAWVVGTRLTRFQVIVINCLYVIWICSLMSGYLIAASGAMELEFAIHQLSSSDIKPADTTFANYSFNIVQAAGLIFSLLFMWSVRRSRSNIG